MDLDPWGFPPVIPAPKRRVMKESYRNLPA